MSSCYLERKGILIDSDRRSLRKMTQEMKFQSIHYRLYYSDCLIEFAANEKRLF